MEQAAPHEEEHVPVQAPEQVLLQPPVHDSEQPEPQEPVQLPPQSIHI